MRYLLALAVVVSVIAQAEPKSKPVYRKTQEVNFEETDIDGVVRSPDGAYLLQKEGLNLCPFIRCKSTSMTKLKIRLIT